MSHRPAPVGGPGPRRRHGWSRRRPGQGVGWGSDDAGSTALTDVGGARPHAVPAYLDAHSGLPGPRGNLELAVAFARVWGTRLAGGRAAGGPDEYRRMCGTVARRLACSLRLRTVCGRPWSPSCGSGRWTTRGACARASRWRGSWSGTPTRRSCARRWPHGRRMARHWCGVPLSLLVRAAGCSHDEQTVGVALAACAAATDFLAGRPAGTGARPTCGRCGRRSAYCWSVAVAADPGRGLPSFDALTGRPTLTSRGWCARTGRRSGCRWRETGVDDQPCGHVVAGEASVWAGPRSAAAGGRARGVCQRWAPAVEHPVAPRHSLPCPDPPPRPTCAPVPGPAAAGGPPSPDQPLRRIGIGGAVVLLAVTAAFGGLREQTKDGPEALVWTPPSRSPRSS